jgi:hypothetical protein
MYNNSVYDISSSNTAASNISGIYISSGTTHFIYNNFISEIKVSASSSTSTVVNGLYISGGTNVRVYYNSVYLNATSTGTNFSSSALYCSSSPNLDLRNNILVNASTPNGSGYAVAYRRSSTTLTSHSSLCNNNCFYAGTPSSRRLIFYDGTNSDSTLTQFKTRLNGPENMSVTENVPFLNTSTSPYNLHLSTSTATQCESSGTPVTSPIAVTTDYDNNSRHATLPDIGADEGSFTFNDLRPPTITYTALPNTHLTSARTLIATITDFSSVPTSGTGLPKLYWRVNSGSYTNDTATYIGNNQFQFSFGGGVSTTDTV